MKFYWRERGYYQSVLLIAGPVTILGVLASIGFWSQIRQHPTNNHHAEIKSDRSRYNQSRRQKSKA